MSQRGPQPTLVQVVTVSRADLQAKVTANGRVQAQKKVDISALIPGQITRLAVKEGDSVQKGQLLLQIDATNARAGARSMEASVLALVRELDSARTNLEQARDDFERAEESHKASIISEAEFRRARSAMARADSAMRAAQARVDQSQAQLEGATDNLAKTTVLAPMSGTVTARNVEEGEVVVIGVLNQPGTVLLTISDMSVVETEMEVDETSIPSVRLGQEARLRIDAYPNRTFGGMVTEVGNSPILKTGAIRFKVKVHIKDPPTNIRPGLSVQADILTGFKAQAIVIPIQALVVRDIEVKPGEAPRPGAPRDEEGVYLIENDKARFQKVKTGLLGELSLEVLEGLLGGETLINGPFKVLREIKPGDLVRADKPKPKDGASG
ncbi:MAG: efflux RND transporter periplasmic adaptor subunit [Vicinamibacteria bacterium]|nr:efflux RND transporter periplasmic adaptor subunit [Vicinamibacteria bacterium]